MSPEPVRVVPVPGPMTVKLAKTGRENGWLAKPRSQPVPLQPSASKPSGSVDSVPVPGAGSIRTDWNAIRNWLRPW